MSMTVAAVATRCDAKGQGDKIGNGDSCQWGNGMCVCVCVVEIVRQKKHQWRRKEGTQHGRKDED